MAKLRYMSRDDFRVLTAVRSSPFPRHPSFPTARPLPVPGSLLEAEARSGQWNAAEVGNGGKSRKSDFSEAFARKLLSYPKHREVSLF